MCLCYKRIGRIVIHCELCRLEFQVLKNPPLPRV